MDKLNLYYLSKYGNDRQVRMEERFKKLNINANLINWVNMDELKKSLVTDDKLKRKYNEWSKDNNIDSIVYRCMFGHLKMIRTFVEESDKEFGCFLEDDVHISRNFTSDINYLLNKMNELELDVLLVGYLLNHDIRTITSRNNFDVIDTITLHRYHDQVWGAQGYILTRKQAIKLLEKYNEEYLINSDENDTPFSSDWTLVKDGNRALVYPMYFVEEGNISGDHPGQVKYHRECFEFNYDEKLYV